MKKEQLLSYYPLTSLNDIDCKIKEVGEYWRRIENIKVEYFGGAYQVTMLAKELKGEQI